MNAYGNGIAVETVLVIMDRHDLPESAHGQGELLVHDPWPLRQEENIQNAVRSIVSRIGKAVEKIQQITEQNLMDIEAHKEKGITLMDEI